VTAYDWSNLPSRPAAPPEPASKDTRDVDDQVDDALLEDDDE
jgi:hypothetical protein